MFGEPRIPTDTEITKVRKSGSSTLWTWRCLVCHDCQGGQYWSWFSAVAVAGIHRKVHHTG